jgi:dipeptidyl-peptidase 4
MRIKRFIYIWFIVASTTRIYCQNSFLPISLENIYKNYIFLPRSVYSIEPMNDGEHYTVLEGGTSIDKYSFKSGERIETLFSLNKTNNQMITAIEGYELNKDESKILFSSNSEDIYRHSFKADYYIWDLKLKKLTPLSLTGKQQLASFSSDGLKIAFIRDNNLFVSDLVTGNEIQVTTDGKYNEIINGEPDWVYEEEFSFTKGYQWSAGDDKIAFYRFDESKVKEYSFPVYDSLYPRNYRYKYPKAGEENSIVSVWVYDCKSGKLKKMDVGDHTDQYIPRILWTNKSNALCILRMNRCQNKLDVMLADVNTGKSRVVMTDENKSYVSEPTDHTIVFISNKKFIFTSEKDGFRHLYLYRADGKLLNQITKGDWDDGELIGYNPDKEVIYYSSHEDSPSQKNIYCIKPDGTEKRKISLKNGTNSIVFGKGFKYYVNYYSNANTPNYVTVHDESGKMIRVLEDNAALKGRMKEFGFAKKEFITVKTKDHINLNAYMIKPLNFDPNKRYPLFMFVYGGPESQSVTDDWSRDLAWFEMLAQKGYIVACVDNRGTDARGEEFRKCTYMQLGKLETTDQIEAARYFSSFSFIDSTRIGIFGWSYGGFMSALCMTKGADVFKAGIAVAPVTNWRFYDNIYTERYMRTPKENPSGYDNNSPINFVSLLKGKFLLIHGTADDNVHLQNSMELVNKLVDEGKQFEMQVYPNKNHGIYGPNTTLHLYTRMTNFILENL